MSKRERAKVDPVDTQLDLRHLRREAQTALELAVVALAPSDLIDRLASVAGLFEALVELPADSPPVIALVPKLTKRSRAALAAWDEWRAAHLAKAKA